MKFFYSVRTVSKFHLNNCVIMRKLPSFAGGVLCSVKPGWERDCEGLSDASPSCLQEMFVGDGTGRDNTIT